MVSLQAFLVAAALAGSGDTVLLDFTADWCIPCRNMAPTVQRLHDAGYPVRQVNVDQSPELARQFGVGPIPCFVLVKDGQEVDRVVGSASYDRLAQMFAALPQQASSADAQRMRGQSPDDLSGPSGRLPGTSLQSLPGIDPPPRDNARGALEQPTRDLAYHQCALEASVRITVVDNTGQSHGTGTIIDTHGNEALVLTCGHIFRESGGRGEIQVELFAPGAPGPVRGTLIAYEAEERDIGLVSIRPGIPVRPVPVASTDYRPQRGEPVFSVGCDHGANPTVRETTISAIDRYAGPPNLEIHGHPVQGRSGGGLFSADGRIIGVCNAADLQEDRGIYAGLPTIYLELQQIGQERIYMTDQSPSAAPSRTRPRVPLVPVSGRATSAVSQPSAAEMEVICIIRSRDNVDRDGKVLMIDRPSTELIQLLARESQQLAGGHTGLESQPAHNNATAQQAPPLARQGVVRAQGN